MVVVVVVKRRTPAKRAQDPEHRVASRPMSRDEIAAAVSDIKQLARRMRPPMNNKPAAFHEDKSDLVRAAERLEDAIRFNRPLRQSDELEASRPRA